ncbi:MAG: TIGR03936 family radical SAM-associated protein [Clostridiales bacterium]|nr:TIGR03936 family radical SAM-associated protein [Clostridiales bacterium]
MAFKYRLKFAKLGLVKFVGHLDLLKALERAVMRGRVPVAFSHGFNRHQLITIAQPLPLGMESVGEYADIELARQITPEELAERLNAAMPSGLRALAARQLAPGEKNAAAATAAAEYEIMFEDFSGLQERVNELLAAEQVIVQKKSKRQERQADIRPDIFKIEVLDARRLRALLAAGSSGNLSPRVLAEALARENDWSARYRRLEMFGKRGGGFEAL